eukprot:TRINITY_DN9957_c0_g1_i2.p1 TRINITY_DN9957_c0_g1~~TRINITY_DN9957_c0_g1_i2.p1  ORF type:complete len:155 (+),score=13.40 TRINITY_DN9957_c0_g1_i2:48-467(+)
MASRGKVRCVSVPEPSAKFQQAWEITEGTEESHSALQSVLRSQSRTTAFPMSMQRLAISKPSAKVREPARNPEDIDNVILCEGLCRKLEKCLCQKISSRVVKNVGKSVARFADAAMESEASVSLESRVMPKRLDGYVAA